MLVATVAVNAVTVSIIVRHYTANNAATYESTNSANGDKAQVINDTHQESVFGNPEKITLHGDGKAVTLTSDDKDFKEIIKNNENRTTFIREYQKTGVFDENALDVYYMEFSYSEPQALSLKGVGEYEVSSIIFVLTGVHHGKMKFEAGGEYIAVEKLAFDPELLVKVAYHLE